MTRSPATLMTPVEKVFGAFDNGSAADAHEVYDALNDDWIGRTLIPSSMGECEAVVVDGRAHVIRPSRAFEYDPEYEIYWRASGTVPSTERR